MSNRVSAASSVPLAAITRRLLDSLEPETPGFARRVQGHRLGPAAYNLGMAGFRVDYLASLAMAERRGADLEEVVAALVAQQVDAIPIKGMAYLGWLYADPALRPMSDIDLLVRPDAHSRAVSVLESCGYLRCDARPGSRSRYHHATTFRRGRQYIDLHRNIQQPLRTALDVDALFIRAQAGRGGLARLSLADTALVHFAHVARSELNVPALCYLDGALILQLLAPADFAQLWARARRYRLLRGLRASIAMTKSLTTEESWRPLGFLSASLPQPDEILGQRRPSRHRQLARKIALCDDARSVTGLLAGTLLDRFSDWRTSC